MLPPWVLQLVTAILKATLPAIFEASKDTAEDGARDLARRDRLRAEVLKHWGKVAITTAVLGVTAGCGVRTVYVRDGTPVRLRETIKAVPVWVLDADGKPQASEMDLLEGWYALPDPGEDK